jgi:hypothetical protein
MGTQKEGLIHVKRGEDSVFEPGPGAERLRGLMKKVLSRFYGNGSCLSL